MLDSGTHLHNGVYVEYMITKAQEAAKMLGPTMVEVHTVQCKVKVRTKVWYWIFVDDCLRMEFVTFSF